jgi:short-subunit dehydrogenase
MSKTAVITGATSGIGAAFAKRLAAAGYDLIITGRKRELIEKLADELRKKHGVNIKVIIAELSNDNDIQKVIDTINAADNIDMLINNAGYSGYARNFIEVEPAHYEQMIKVHQVVPMRLVSVVAPKMIKQGKGTIINTSSIAAYNALPTAHVYGGTKSFLKIFSEGLYQELRAKGIKIQALCPGFTDTNFAKDYMTEEEYTKLASSTKRIMMSPEAVVDYSLKRLKKNKVVCIPGLANKAICFTLPKLPRGLYYKLAAKMTGL